MSYTGEPGAHLLCHCADCRKITGATYSNNLVLPESQFRLESGILSLFSFPLVSTFNPVLLILPQFSELIKSGKPKTASKKADSGKTITSHFCNNCGTTLYRTGDSFPGQVILKAGVLDDGNWPNENVPRGELYIKERVNWMPAISGAAQMEGMPS